MCICCDPTLVLKPMDEFSASELSEAQACCLKPSVEDGFNNLPLLSDIESWVESTFDSLDDDEIFNF